jgi:hypothetical protein
MEAADGAKPMDGREEEEEGGGDAAKGANEGSRIRRLSADINAEGPPKNYGSSILGHYLSC